MAEFYSFTALGENFLGSAYRLKPGAGRAALYEAALHRAGTKWRDELRARIWDGGPGWEDLSSATEQRRMRADLSPQPPLFATMQMHEALKYEVKGMNVEIGVDDKNYVPEGGYGTGISMSDLFIYHEIGTKHMPPRPVFGHPEMQWVERSIVAQFALDVINSGITEGPAARARAELRRSLGM
jgi:hypothetical protein